MLGRTVIKRVQRYLRLVQQAGIPVEAGIVYGSHARGEARRGSDIDLLVVSPQFDGNGKSHEVDMLWKLRGRVDWRIEPVAVGSRRFRTDLGSPLLAAARQEGVVVSFAQLGDHATNKVTHRARSSGSHV